MVAVEFAALAPLFFVIIFGVMHFAWIGAQIALVSHASVGVAQEFTRQDAESATDLNALLAARITQAAQPLPVNVSVTNATVVARDNDQVTEALPAADSAYGITQLTRGKTTMRIKADVRYEVKPLVPIKPFESFVDTLALDKTLIVSSVWEVH